MTLSGTRGRAARGQARPEKVRKAGGIRRTALRAAAAAVVAGLSAASVVTVAAQAAHAARAHGGRGSIVSAALVGQMSADQARAYLKVCGYDAATTRYGVDVYRVVYRTLDERNAPTTASGVVVFPQGKKGTLRVADFEHGTMVDKQDAPSVSPGDRLETTLLAGAGYAAVEPDYLGLGLGPGRPTYLDAASETTASADMLRAAWALAARTGRHLGSRVLVSGFSQGAQAAMALSRALQGGTVPGLRLAAVAGISGPYDLQHAQLPASLSGALNPVFSEFYLGYWLTAQNPYYRFYANPAEAFQPPFDQTAEGLFDGTHADTDVFNALPASPQKLFTPGFLQRLSHPSGPVLAALRADDTVCTAWTPRVPVRLYDADADTQATNLNTRHCAQDLTSRGAAVSVIDVGRIDHFPSEKAALPQIVTWFETIEHP